MIKWLRNALLVRREKRAAKDREQKVMEECGCRCRCPNCNDILNDQAVWTNDPTDDGHGEYTCSCGHVSEWHFGLAPIPILLDNTNYGEHKKRNEQCLTC